MRADGLSTLMFALFLAAASGFHIHDNEAQSLARYDDFVARLTLMQRVDGQMVRTVLSSGGVAGDQLVSEGQAYGLLITAGVANGLPWWHPRRRAVLDVAYEIYLGWRTMARRSGQMEGATGHTDFLTCQTAMQDVADGPPVRVAQCGGAFGITPPSAPPHPWTPPPPGSPPTPRAVLPAGGPPRPPPPPKPPPPPPPLPDPTANSGGPTVTPHVCLPSWKWSRDLLEQLETGSASDADADALLGMILLVSAATTVGPDATAEARAAAHPQWLNQLILLTYQTSVAFLRYETQAHPRATAADGYPLYLPKLGSCFGGWTCTSPSYLAPGHYRAVRDFVAHYEGLVATDPALEHAPNAVDMGRQLDSLIEGSLNVLNESICSSGVVSNWWVPSAAAELRVGTISGARADHSGGYGSAWTPGTATCMHSATEADEFGAEASRTAWRVALTALWYANETSGARAGELSERIARGMSAEWVRATNPSAALADESAGFSATPVDFGSGSGGAACNVSHLFPAWQSMMFMVAPVATAVFASLQGAAAPADAAAAAERAQRETALAQMDAALNSFVMVDASSYYSGSWSTIASLTISGLLRPPTFAAYNATEMWTHSPPPLAPPASPNSSSPTPTPPAPPPPPTAPNPPYWHEYAITMTWSIFGGSLLVGVCFCCCMCRCLHHRISTTHWRSQRYGWAQAEAAAQAKKSTGFRGSGRFALRKMSVRGRQPSSAA